MPERCVTPAREAQQVVGDGLSSARQNQRTRAHDAAQEDLQPAIAAHVVEGRPDDALLVPLHRGDRACQAFETVHHELRHAGRAGCQQQPFGRTMTRRRLARRDRQPTSDARQVEAGESLGLSIGDDELGRGRRSDRGEILGRQIARTQGDAARQPVEQRG